MKKILSIVLFTVFLGGSSDDCQCKQVRLALVGDSLMTGPCFKAEIARWAKETNSEFVILAKKGRKAVGSVFETALKEEVKAFRPTHIAVYLGVNDCAQAEDFPMYGPDGGIDGWGYGPLFAITLAGKALNYWFITARRMQAVPILVKHQPWKGYKKARHNSWLCSQGVNEELGQGMVYGKKGIIVDWLQGWQLDTLPERFDAGDGLHLNCAGQRLLAREILMEVD